MDNNPLTPRASNFSIASLITSDGCDDENSLYHSINSPIGTLPTTPIHFNHSNLSIEKIPTDFYSNSLQTDSQSHYRSATTLTETNNGQSSQQSSVTRETRSNQAKTSHPQATNLQKSLTSIRNMEGKTYYERKKTFSLTNILLSYQDYIQSATEKIKSSSATMIDMNKSDNENGSNANGTNETKKPLHPKLTNIKMVIESKSLWDEFDKLGTEMIVTRSGR